MITINELEDNDLAALALLLGELTGKKTEYNKMEMNYNWMKANPNYHLLGAKYNGELVGTIMGIVCRDLVGECRPFMVIDNVIVKKSMRGKRIGRDLISKIEDIGRENNCYYTMFVSTMEKKDAHRFYESVGYRLDTVQGFKKHLDGY